MYDKEVIHADAMKVIKKHKLIFISDVADMVGIDRRTYYNLFKEGSEERASIQKALRSNKLQTRIEIRKKWANSDSFQPQLALYRLCATGEELDALDIGGRREKAPYELSDSQIERLVAITTPNVEDVKKLFSGE